MFSFLQIALIMGLQTLQAHEVRLSWGLQTRPGPAAGGLAQPPGHSSALGTVRLAGQGRRLEVSAKKEKHTAVNRGDPCAQARAGVRTAPAPGEDPQGKAATGRGGASSLPFLPLTRVTDDPYL